ncbi:MAG TPA: hypothetical protein VGS19_31065 [Streptosporangiaceae bacterium]|nr:hypothetical protein [Streptosporangiaceae bacterium]
MKRVKYLAGAAGLAPAALGLAMTAPAAAATASHSTGHKTVRIPFTSNKVCDHHVCIKVYGAGNDISKVVEWIYNSTYRPDTFQLWASSPHNRFWRLWKSTYGGYWSGWNYHTWYPACSFPGSGLSQTSIQGRATRATGTPTVGVYGSNWTGNHPCLPY